MFRRGEIYYIEKKSFSGDTGSEQISGRPAIIVSNDKANTYSSVLEVVYLTTQNKNDLPTHIDIRSTGKSSIALCEQIHSISTDRFGDYIATCTDYEMMMVDAALAISLGLDFSEPTRKPAQPEKTEVVTPLKEEKPKDSDDKLQRQVIELSVERDTFKNLYEQLLERVMSSK